jgi:hypothetical protein
MSKFSVRVLFKNGKPAADVGVMIDYGWLGGCVEKRTHSDGWVNFHNHENRPGTIWVHGHNMGSHRLEDGNTYSFAI